MQCDAGRPLPDRRAEIGSGHSDRDPFCRRFWTQLPKMRRADHGHTVPGSCATAVTSCSSRPRWRCRESATALPPRPSRVSAGCPAPQRGHSTTRPIPLGEFRVKLKIIEGERHVAHAQPSSAPQPGLGQGVGAGPRCRLRPLGDDEGAGAGAPVRLRRHARVPVESRLRPRPQAGQPGVRQAARSDRLLHLGT